MLVFGLVGSLKILFFLSLIRTHPLLLFPHSVLLITSLSLTSRLYFTVSLEPRCLLCEAQERWAYCNESVCDSGWKPPRPPSRPLLSEELTQSQSLDCYLHISSGFSVRGDQMWSHLVMSPPLDQDLQKSSQQDCSWFLGPTIIEVKKTERL